MKIDELLFPASRKGNKTNTRDIHNPYLPQDEIRSRIAEYTNAGKHFQVIMRRIYDEFGADGVAFARQEMPYLMREALKIAPTKKEQFQKLTELFKQKLPAGLAPTLLCGLLEDDALSDVIATMEEDEDARPVVKQWLELNMPDMLETLIHGEKAIGDKEGILSPIHGYNSNDYVGNASNANWGV